MQNDPISDDMNDKNLSAEAYQKEARTFQDDMVTDDTVIDPIMLEHQGKDDDPVEILGVPPQILEDELDKRAFDGTGEPVGDIEPGTTLYEGTEDTGGDVYNEQQDAFDQASDAIESQDGEDGSRAA